jgi:hypothetical protein
MAVQSTCLPATTQVRAVSMRFRQFAAISTVVLFCGRASVEQTGLPVYGRLSGEKRKPWFFVHVAKDIGQEVSSRLHSD